jgi:hypothetical protein
VAARTLAELARLQAELTAVEVPLPLLELGGGAHGFWFAATDRELTEGRRPREPDEYAGLVQGAAAVGGLLVPFTLLDDGDGPHRAEVLDLLRRASHEAPGAPAPAAAAAVAETPSRGDAWPMVLTFPGRPWSVMMETPGFEVAASRLRPDRRLVSVVAHHPATGVVASLVLSDAGLRRTAAACAEADWLRLQAFLPEVAGRAPPGGPRPRAAYLVHELDGRAVEQQNGSAWWLRDGVCVHAHVSKMGFAPTDQPALDRLLDSVRFQEPL